VKGCSEGFVRLPAAPDGNHRRDADPFPGSSRSRQSRDARFRGGLGSSV